MRREHSKSLMNSFLSGLGCYTSAAHIVRDQDFVGGMAIWC
jgi:hypothetical protein